jgi:putative photosynthetic complex assembly protein
MSTNTQAEQLPRPALVGAAVLVGSALLLAATVRLGGFDIRSLPEPQPRAVVDLKFQDLPDGAVAVSNARSGAVIEVIPFGTNGFLRAMMRNLAHDRRRRGIGDAVPFHLFSSTEGRLVLEDPTSGTHIELEAFGPTNAGVFARFLGETR